MERYFDVGNIGVSNKIILVTGATSGIGLEVASVLLRAGAVVILGTRSGRVRNRVKKLLQNPGASLLPLDLADTGNIEAAVELLKDKFDRVDILINNAGIMEPPYALTRQGFESQFGVNYMGHCVLTLLLLRNFPSLARVVTVSSLAAQHGVLQFESFRDHPNYDKSASYCQSKLANLVFGLELNERLQAAGSHTRSVVAHPGYARTRLQRHAKGVLRKAHILLTRQLRAQSAAAGALPILFAATDEQATGTEYYVPGGPLQLSGEPIKVAHPGLEVDPAIRAKLWAYTENQTNLKLEI